jgi:DNA repair exonuclease SbcCD ATPase subunit
LNKDLNDNLSLIEDNSTTFDNLINETNSRIDLVKVEIDNIKKVINLLDVVKFVVSEEGVKSFIVKKILQNFNSKLSYYLKKLDSNSICIFNEYFEDEILNEKGKICSYNNFSGAERKAIDLACLFSFMDMRKSQGNVHFNVSIYDELLDSSLDEKGVDIVLGLLKERSDKFNECIMIISHRKESIKSATGDVIFLEKYNGITKRINYVE